LDVRTAREVQKEQETTDQIMNKLFENPKLRNAVEQALRPLKRSHIANNFGIEVAYSIKCADQQHMVA
jgi:hypothetical protein